MRGIVVTQYLHSHGHMTINNVNITLEDSTHSVKEVMHSNEKKVYIKAESFLITMFREK